MTPGSMAAVRTVGPHRGRTAAPALRRTASWRTGREDRTMAQPRRPRWPSAERIVKLLVSMAGALAELIEAFRRLR